MHKQFNLTVEELDSGLSERDYQDTCKLLAAAVINKQFRKQLLTNPEKALESGFAGQQFQIGTETKEKIGMIRANNLSDFANQFSQSFSSGFDSILVYAGD